MVSRRAVGGTFLCVRTIMSSKVYQLIAFAMKYVSHKVIRLKHTSATS